MSVECYSVKVIPRMDIFGLARKFHSDTFRRLCNQYTIMLTIIVSVWLKKERKKIVKEFLNKDLP